MTHEAALDRMIEKLEDRLARGEKRVRDSDNTPTAPYERGFVAATEIALEDARTLAGLAE